MVVGPADEGFHQPGFETWGFAWPGGLVRQTFTDWTGLLVELFVECRLVVVRDDQVPLQWGRFEHRGDGLWWDIRAQVPMVAWSLQAECFGLEFESAADIAAGLGHRTAVGFDLSFEAAGPPVVVEGGYRQRGSWAGDLLVGDRRLEVTGTGVRDHRWQGAAALSGPAG